MSTEVKRYLRNSFIAAMLLVVLCVDLYIGYLTLKMRTSDGIAMGLGFVELAGIAVVLPASLIFFLLKPSRPLKIGFSILLVAFISFLVFN